MSISGQKARTIDRTEDHKLEADAKRSSLKIDHGLQPWLVVASCSLINLILFGIYRSYALLYTALLENYHINRTQASWPFSLCMTVIHLCGPVSGLLNSKFSIRTIYASGCFLATLGIGLCYFATNISHISWYIGVIQGVGIGLTYVQSVAILGEYFNKKLGLANGISMAGGTVGPFILSPLLNFALENLGLKGSFIILTSITMLTIPLCVVLKHNRKPKTVATPSNSPSKLNKYFQNSNSYNLKQHGNLSLICNSSLPSSDKFTVSLKRFKTLDELDTQRTIVDNCNEMCKGTQTNSIAPIEKLSTDSIGKNSIKDAPQILNQNGQHSNNKTSPLFVIDYNQEHPPTVRENLFSIVKKQFSKFKSSGKRMNSIKLSKPALKLQNSLTSTNSMVAFTLNNVFTVVSSVYFLLIMYTHLAYFWSIITYQMIIVDFSMDCNIPKYLANNMITSFSLGDLCGRLGSGWIIDKKFFANKHYFLASNLLIAILFNLLNFVQDYYGLLIITCLLGILAGAIVILINVCLCEYLGKKRASLGFGMSAFCCGIATLARPNLIGYFRDILGSYNELFNLLSVLCYIASLIWLIEIIITRIRIKQKLSNTQLPIDRKL